MLDKSATVYDQIELFGLTETDDDLPIPNDDELRTDLMQRTFDALFEGMTGTGLHREIEPIAHGLASLIFRRRNAIQKQLSDTSDSLRGLIRAADGSEVLETQMDELQRKADRFSDLLDALDIMAETAAQCYEQQTGAAFLPAANGRTSRLAHLTGTVFEAHKWLEAHEREQAAQFEIEGTPLAIAGDRDWMDHEYVWATLDKIRGRFKETFATELILYHKADKKGVDAIAAAWARNRKVPQVTFQPNWRAFGNSAGFKAIDQMLDTPKPLGGVVIFGKTGIALNLADKAERKGIKAMRVDLPAKPKS
ncbi:DUF2493 domain-containing protein [uncultured Ruegeria sp.]|uniref:DUF2493 domain-containing protein n=1 Tax=uncultured Ruegeria sp. TaxID=259304 RepID=UPI002633A0A9|nr:DUF2493 domain-containing protein [uncultured Ruegeria sp.]